MYPNPTRIRIATPLINPPINPPDTDTPSTAQLLWDADGQPISSAFGDVYFSRANGLQETRHVFLHHNQLAERWQQLAPHAHFTLGETGFGSGLNFLAAWQLWLTTAPRTARLHFVTVEKFPLQHQDLRRALALWPELDGLAHQLLDAYPAFIGAGFHRREFMGGRVNLTLIINDATQGLQQLLATPHPLFADRCAKIDAWFLDGFAPAKNPQMWSDDLFATLRLLSHTHTTVATFSAAAIVKNGLKNAGFRIEKVAGFGRKRDMVKGWLSEPAPKPPAADFTYPGSYSPYPVPWTIPAHNPRITEKHALVIGGGLAGCSSARALAERGWHVTLIERHAELAQEASGNPQGVLYAKLSHKTEMQGEFNLTALQFALHHYAQRWPAIGQKTGVLHLAYCASEQQLHHQLKPTFLTAPGLVQWLTAAQASELAGTEIACPALYFPQAGWIQPRALCAHWVNHPAIQVITHTTALDLAYRADRWHLRHDQGESSAPVVILANARDAQHFPEAAHLPIKTIRGQTTDLPQTVASQALNTVICAEGYLSPAHQGIHCTGATFTLKDNSSTVQPADHQANLDKLHACVPGLAPEWQALDLRQITGRVAFRCTLPDYLPAVGPLPDEAAMLRDFAPLRKNSRAGIPRAGTYHPGLYINIGHGSRGLAYTPLCADLLAALINHELLPVPQGMANALNPARFLIRDMIRNKR